MLMTVIMQVAFLLGSPELPDVTVTADDVIITRSCRIIIPSGTVIEDRNGDGVIHISAANIQVEFSQGSVLRGSPLNRWPNAYRGYGIRLNNQKNVTIRGGQISGFWGGLWASRTHGLTLETMDLSDNRRPS